MEDEIDFVRSRAMGLRRDDLRLDSPGPLARSVHLFMLPTMPPWSLVIVSAVLAALPGAAFADEAGEPFAPRSTTTSVTPGFTRLSAEASGFSHVNTYRDPSAWTDRYLAATAGSVGTGLGVADFNGDGWPDVFVAMREGQSRLYLNEGGERFVDFTSETGILENRDWATGVTVVDINGDHRPDLYLCYFNSPNRLYVNQGGARFKEAALTYGLAVRDASNAAFFADYNRDGQLDLFLQTNIIDGRHGGNGQPDYLFRNDGAAGFTNVTGLAGIRSGPFGGTQGHSALWLDFDEDGWEDLYVANDFSTHDYLYRNLGDGTFEEMARVLPAVPFSSMGSDVGDVNGDGRLDLVTTDMAATSFAKHAVSMGTNARKTYALSAAARPPMLMKNALLLNRGAGDFIDVAYAWNLAATDWTWAVRLADLDNDGWTDAFFTNGMIRQFHNADLSYKQDGLDSIAARDVVFRDSPVLREGNLMFRNRGGQDLAGANDAWGYEHNGVSFGAVVFDFNRDGALDVLYSNYEEPPTLWRNDLPVGNAVQVRLIGQGANTEAVGAVVVAAFGEQTQAQKVLSNRGYLSSDDKVLHFGLGAATQIDRLEIRWPDGTWQEERNLTAGARYSIRQDTTRQSAGEIEPSRLRTSARLSLTDARPAASAPASAAVADSTVGPLYPFSPIPNQRPTEWQADFVGDDSVGSFILRPWRSPQLVIKTADGPVDVSADWGLDRFQGLYERALVTDLNDDGYPDVILGGLGINHEISYRGTGDGRLVRLVGRFTPGTAALNLNAFEWSGVDRLYDSLIDLADANRRAPSFFSTFEQFGGVDLTGFLEHTRFAVEETHTLTHFRSLVLLNRAGRGFDPFPLPQEAQYGRVWDLLAKDLDGDGRKDLILLLGQVSPHVRSPQAASSSVSILLGQGDGRFRPDDRPPFERPPDRIVTALSWASAEGEDGELVLHLENDQEIVARVLR